MAVEKIDPGIRGIDAVLPEGIPRGASVLLSGPCGSGKVLLASEFLYRAREPGIYYTFETDKQDLLDSLSVFSWKIEDRINSGQFNIIKSELYRFEAFLSDLEDNIDKLGAGRLVLDSLSILGQFFESKYNFRKSLIELRHALRNAGVTSLMLSEVPDGNALSTFGVEEFVLDGVMRLHFIQKDSTVLRGISVRKMKGVVHDTSIHPLEITRSGLKVHRMREII